MLDSIVSEVHATAKDKGWWQLFENGTVIQRPSLEIRMLIVSELAEATEEVRTGSPPIYAVQTGSHATSARIENIDYIAAHKLKPEGEAVELADAVIRIADYFGSKRWSLERHLNDHVELPTFQSALEYHMHFVRMISQADGHDEEKNLGRTVALIRYYFTLRGWDFEKTLRLKIDYNKTRPYRHGNKAH